MIKNILLVDDDSDDALLFSKALSEIDQKTNFRYWGIGPESIGELIKNEAFIPHVIFLDIHMPVTNGWECLRALKAVAAFRNTPVVMYSSSNIEEAGMAANDVGVAALMTKPSAFDELKIKLAGILQTLFSDISA